jgi:hypothetical protein
MAELVFEIVGMFPKAFSPQDRDSTEHRVPDLVEPTRLIALFADSERLPVVEISGEIEVEAVASRHGAVKSAPAVEFQREGFHEADGEDVVDGRGLTGIPVALGRRLLSPSSGDPDLGLDGADEREAELSPAPRDSHVEGGSGRYPGRRTSLILELGGRDPVDARDAVAPSKPRALDPLRRREHRELSSGEVPDLTRGGPRLLAQKVDEALARLSLELVRLSLRRRRRRSAAR